MLRVNGKPYASLAFKPYFAAVGNLTTGRLNFSLKIIPEREFIKRA
jgi:hypothetical protein